MSKSLKKQSRYLSYLLRHNPWDAGLHMDEHGWVSVKELSNVFDVNTIKEIVLTDNKGRYEFNLDRTMIRACQGHSIKVNMQFEEFEPLGSLYHGTAERFIEKIECSGGLGPMGRQYVHLSRDYGIAVRVGSRHGKPVVYEIDVVRMYRDGIKFYISHNNVVLVERVDMTYMKLKEGNDA